MRAGSNDEISRGDFVATDCDGVIIEKMGISVDALDTSVFVDLFAAAAEERNDVFLVGNNGREIVAELATVDFRIRRKFGVSMRKAETDCIRNVASVEIATTISVGFDDGDFKFFIFR